MDLGNYERYLDVTLSRDNNITTGKIYKEVIEKEVRAATPRIKSPPAPDITTSAEGTSLERPCRCDGFSNVKGTNSAKMSTRSCLMLRTRSKIGSSVFQKFPWTRRTRSLTSASSRYLLSGSRSLLVVNPVSKLGGTVGDIESAPFIEAMRQFQFRVGPDNFALIHVSLVPEMHGEQKTKPTQTTVHALRGLGLLPDIVSTLNPTWL